jgi:transcriptional regulator with XRE-family HTH domain
VQNLTPKKPNPDDIRAGANIRRIRASRGMSQTELGEALGITFQQIQKYEKGTNRVSSSRLVAIAQLLAVSLADLFSGTDLETIESYSLPVMSRQALRIAVAFDAIPDERQRAYLLRLVESMGNPPPARGAAVIPMDVDMRTVAVGGVA